MDIPYRQTLSGDQIKKLRQFQVDDILPDNFEASTVYVTFNSELEKELAKWQAKWVDVDEEIDVAKGVVLDTITQDFQDSVDYRRLKFGLRGVDITVNADTGNDSVRITGKVEGYLGRTGRGNLSKRDIGYIERGLVPTTIPLDSVDGLSINRKGNPSFTPMEILEEPLRSVGQGLKATHYFKQEYETLVPNGILPEIFFLHGPQAKG